jgi:hypothetical protein
LVVDRRTGEYLCSWYAGKHEAHLVDHARVADAPAAVAWGLERTPKVRIRGTDALTHWAGSAARPPAFESTWVATPMTTNVEAT